MARSKAQDSFADMVAQGPAVPPIRPEQRDNVTTSKLESVKPRPHVSLYVSREVQRTVKQIALSRPDMTRPHDIYTEGLRHVLREHGFDFDALNDDEGV